MSLFSVFKLCQTGPSWWVDCLTLLPVFRIEMGVPLSGLFKDTSFFPWISFLSLRYDYLTSNAVAPINAPPCFDGWFVPNFFNWHVVIC